MNIERTRRFHKSFDNLTEQLKKKTQKQIVIFIKNLFHPSLHTEKLEPKEENIWSFRIDKSYRVLFTFLPNNTIFFIDLERTTFIKNCKVA